MEEQNQNTWGKVSFSSLESLYNFLFLFLFVMTIFLTQLESLDFTDGKEGSFCGVIGELSLSENMMPSSLRRALPNLAHTQGLFGTLLGDSQSSYKLEKSLQQTPSGSCRVLHPSF